MKIENKLDKSFGPFGSSTGFFLLIGGIICIYFSLLGITFVVLGAFAAFTNTSTIIDTDKKRIKHSDNLFGFIQLGKWVDIRPDMKFGLKKVKRGFVGYIKGNQPFDIQYNDIRIFLYDSENRPIMPVKKFNSFDSAQNDLKSLVSLFNLTLI